MSSSPEILPIPKVHLPLRDILVDCFVLELAVYDEDTQPAIRHWLGNFEKQGLFTFLAPANLASVHIGMSEDLKERSFFLSYTERVLLQLAMFPHIKDMWDKGLETILDYRHNFKSTDVVLNPDIKGDLNHDKEGLKILLQQSPWIAVIYMTLALGVHQASSKT